MKYLMIFVLLSLSVCAFGQEKVSISGGVFDNLNDLPLAYASVSVYTSSEGILVSGAVSNQEGRFILRGIDQGDYKVHVAYIGYETLLQEIHIGELNKIFDLGRMKLVPESQNLEQVTISVRKEITDPDLGKKTYNMDDLLSQSGGSVLDAMKGMPGVTVDQDGKVILRGSDKVVILIDGKQSSLTGYGNQKGLDNIPASNINEIEIINNPSAKYDAAGMAGIINIVYKKQEQYGFNGDIGLAYGMGALTKRKPDLNTSLGSFAGNPKYIPSLNVNYRTGKLNFFLQSELLNQEKLPNNEFTTRYYSNGDVIASQVPENRKQTHYIFKGGVDWEINDINTFTVSGIYDWEHHIDSAQVPYIDLANGVRNRYVAWNENEITGYMNYMAAYKHLFEGAGHELSVNIQYTKGWEDETYYLHDSSGIRFAEDITSILATEHTGNISADYVKPLRFGRLEAGTKLQVRRLPVDFSVERSDPSSVYPGLGDWSDWGENIYAGYLNYIYEKQRFDFEVGLRAERTSVFYNIDPNNIYYEHDAAYTYNDWFNNIRVSYKINKHHSLSIFHNRRIDRPGEPELRIFPKSDDQELLKSGNPYLRPQYTRSFEAAYRLKWTTGSFFLAGYYRLINDPFMRIYSIDTTNIEYQVVAKVYANAGSATNTGIEILFSQSVGEIWKLSGSLNLYRNKIAGPDVTILFPYSHWVSIESSLDNTMDLKINNQFKLPYDIQLQASVIYYAPKNIPQGTQAARSSIDMGFKKKVIKGRGEISLTASDIFNRFGINQEISQDDIVVSYQNYYETQIFRIGMKYKF